MTQLQFILSGGLGNQIFQYLGSKYILKMIPEIEVSYALSEYLMKGYRSFDINKIIIDEIKIDREYNSYRSKVFNKIINNIVFLNRINKTNLMLKFKFLETIDENEFIHKYKFENTLLGLYQKL